MKFIELKKHLTGERKPAYLLTGDDPSVISLAADMLTGLVTTFPEFNLSLFSGAFSADELIASCQGLPLGGAVHVVGVTDAAGDFAALKDYLKSPNPTTVLFFTMPTLVPGVNAILDKIEVVDCNRLDERTLLGWIGREAARREGAITEGGARLLIAYTNRSLTRIGSELNKLLCYTDAPVTEEDVRELVTPDLEFKIFELSEALSYKHSEQALTILDRLMGDNTPPVNLLGMLYGHFRRLLYVSLNPSSDTLASELKIKEYAVKMALRQAKLYTPLRLKAIVEDLHQMDYGIKSGKIGDKAAVYRFVLKTLHEGNQS